MARFWTFSDLHQECAENRFAPRRPTEPFDAVIAAGDVCGTLPDAVGWLRRTFPRDRVVYVAGNHDYWQRPAAEGRLTLWQILDAGREAALRHDVDFLSDDEVTVAGTRVCGCTLWTDYRVDGLGAAHAMRVAEKGMNDYGRIRRPSSSRPTKPVRATDLLSAHRASVAFLDARLGVPFDGPTVVVTHHAPHPRSLERRFDELNGCYASDLTWLVEEHAPAAWVHGHVHVPSDYAVGTTRVLCNPRGHLSEGRQARWRSDLIVDVQAVRRGPSS